MFDNDEDKKVMYALWEVCSNCYQLTHEGIKDLSNTLGAGILEKQEGDDLVSRWHFDGLFPQQIDFGDECYDVGSNSDKLVITWKYNKCSKD